MKNEQTINIEEQIAEAIRNGEALTGQGGVLTPLIHRAVEAALEGEIEAHLCADDSKDNRRNGHNRKQVKSGHGTFELKSGIIKKVGCYLESSEQEFGGIFLAMSFQPPVD